MTIVILEINIYPIKSTAGISLDQGEVQKINGLLLNVTFKSKPFIFPVEAHKRICLLP